MIQVLGTITGIIALCLIAYHGVGQMYATAGPLLWIIPLLIIGGIVFFLSRSDKGIYK